MEIDTVRLAYFSPTGTTKKILEGIAEGIKADDIQHIDLTRPTIKTQELEEIKDGLAIIGAPVYAGRIPPEAISRLRKLRADAVPAVVVALYGNREYEDALIELRDIAVQQGFVPIAGGAFIGEHSFESEGMPIAGVRPDETDIEKAREFGRMVKDKLDGLETLDNLSPVSVPGNTPYIEHRHLRHPPPDTDESLCIKCATCVSVCPTGAVAINGEVVTDADACIACCACVKNCPAKARALTDPIYRRITRWLSTICKERKEPEIFLIQ